MSQGPIASVPGVKELVIPKIVFAVLVVVEAAALGLWLSGPEDTLALVERRPGSDEVPASSPKVLDIASAGKLQTLDGSPGDLPGGWPRFRGAGFDNISPETTPLAKSWPPGGPEALWEIDVGEGHAGAAVLNGRVYLLDYDRERQADVLRCLSLADGKDIWRFSYPVRTKRNHGMSRTVPAVTGKYVVALGPKCHVVCLDPVTGELLWWRDLVREFGGTVPPWYAGQCPLIDGDRAILAPGGPETLMLAVDCRTGAPVWTTPNPRRWTMTHSSIIPMTIEGRRTYVYCAGGGVVGVDASDGKVLWQTDAWKIRIANVPSPLHAGDGRIFLTGGYNAGSMMLQVRPHRGKSDGGALSAEPLYRLKHKIFGAAQHTPILYAGHLYGVRQDGQLVCMDLAGKVLWTSGNSRRFGLGPYLIADGMVFIMDDHGLLTLAQASPRGYTQLAQAKVLPGPDSWGPMALAGGRLILRDLKKMICLDVRAR